jgi:hypothetical protein
MRYLSKRPIQIRINCAAYLIFFPVVIFRNAPIHVAGIGSVETFLNVGWTSLSLQKSTDDQSDAGTSKMV